MTNKLMTDADWGDVWEGAMAAAEQASSIDHEQLLRRYLAHMKRVDGLIYLQEAFSPPFTPAEMAELNRLAEQTVSPYAEPVEMVLRSDG